MNGKHWSDEQLIEHLYGVGPGDGHVKTCAHCQARLHSIQISRGKVEADSPAADSVSHEMLAAQRRAIYRQIAAGQSRAWWFVGGRAWASAALVVALLGGGLVTHDWVVHEKSRTAASDQPKISDRKISDTELAEQVSQIADNAEPQPAAPIEALFQD